MAEPTRRLAGLGLRFALGLAVVLVAVDRAVAAVRVETCQAKYQELFGGGPPCPNVVMGNSRSMYGVDPRALERPGFPLYNFAYEQADATFYEPWYEDFARFYGHPKLVLFGIDWTAFKSYNMARAYAQDCEFWPWPLFLERLGKAHDPGLLLANRFPLIKARGQVQDKLIGTPPLVHYDLAHAYRGFMPMSTDHPMGRGRFPNTYADDPGLIQGFERLVDRLRHDGARLVFFQPMEFGMLVDDHRVQDELVAGIARARGIPYLNFAGDLRSELSADPSLFSDAVHMNAAGATRFSQQLAQALRARDLI